MKYAKITNITKLTLGHKLEHKFTIQYLQYSLKLTLMKIYITWDLPAIYMLVVTPDPLLGILPLMPLPLDETSIEAPGFPS